MAILTNANPESPEAVDDFVPPTHIDGSPFTVEDYDALLDDDDRAETVN